MKLGRRIAMDLTVAQERYMWRAAGVSRFAWNWGKARWDEDWAKAKAEPDPAKRKGMWPSVEQLKEEWAEVRRKEYPWSLEVTKCAGAQAIMDLGATHARAMKERREAKAKRRKPRKQFGFPKYKARNKAKPAFALWNDQIKHLCVHHSAFGKSHSSVHIPNLGMVRLREVVPGMGGILGARISYRRGRWFIAFQFDTDWNDGEMSDKAAQLAQGKARKAAVAAGMDKDEAKRSITVEAERPERLLPLHPAPGTLGGVDLGMIDAAVGRVEKADGSGAVAEFRVANPRRLTRTEKERRTVKRRQRRLSRSIQRARERVAAETKAKRGDTSPVTAGDLKGVKLRLSGRQSRLSRQLAKESWRDADRRDDFLHKLSLQVARSAEVTVVEDLHVAGMMRNHCLARSLSDSALGRLGEFIAYKAEREGGLVLFAPRFFPSSKRCAACGCVTASLELSEREWTCEGCKTVRDRDANAAENLCWLGRLAMGDEPLPEAAREWAEWVDEARAKVAAWRAKKALPRIAAEPHGSLDSLVGAASSDLKRGESAYRAVGDHGRETFDEPRTKKGLKSRSRGAQAHSCAPFG